MSEKATVTVDEAARRLGLGRNATYEAVRNGEVPAIRIGRRWLVPSAALDRLLNDPPHNKAR
jgi:excisionase family DNA binding protein